MYQNEFGEISGVKKNALRWKKKSEDGRVYFPELNVWQLIRNAKHICPHRLQKRQKLFSSFGLAASSLHPFLVKALTFVHNLTRRGPRYMFLHYTTTTSRRGDQCQQQQQLRFRYISLKNQETFVWWGALELGNDFSEQPRRRRNGCEF